MRGEIDTTDVSGLTERNTKRKYLNFTFGKGFEVKQSLRFNESSVFLNVQQYKAAVKT